MNAEHGTSNGQRRIRNGGPGSERAARGYSEIPADERFMRRALDLAGAALAAGEFPVGCVFVIENRVVAQGARAGSAGDAPNEIDHAEMMALREFYQSSPGWNPKEISVYCTLEPCLMCFAALTIAGVGKIVYAYEDAMGGGTDCRFPEPSPFYRERRPVVVPHVLRDESLRMFQRFFENPESLYLKDTHLATYTLSQPSGAS